MGAFAEARYFGLKFPYVLEEMGAFAEALYFGWQNVEPDQRFPVKGHSLNAEQILV